MRASLGFSCHQYSRQPGDDNCTNPWHLLLYTNRVRQKPWHQRKNITHVIMSCKYVEGTPSHLPAANPKNNERILAGPHLQSKTFVHGPTIRRPKLPDGHILGPCNHRLGCSNRTLTVQPFRLCKYVTNYFPSVHSMPF